MPCAASRRSPGTPTSEGRKAPVTRKAGPGFADPDYDLSVEWLEAKRAHRPRRADAGQNPETPSRVLLINGSPRNDGTCPGEISKTCRAGRAGAQAEFEAAADRGRRARPEPAHLRIRPRTSTRARAACRPRCRCATGRAAATRTIRCGQTDDWMNEIYERWVAAHGVIIVTPDALVPGHRARSS